MTTRSPVMLVLALLAGVLVSAGIAACGGTQISADEVKAAPPELTVPTQSPDSADALAGSDDSTSADSGSDADAESDDTSSADSGSQSSDDATTGGTAAPDGKAGTVSPQATPTAAPNTSGGTQAPSQSGSTTTTPGTEKFEEFCQQNAGAC